MENRQYNVTAKDVGFSAKNVEETVKEAYDFGRNKGLIANNYTILWNFFKNKEFALDYNVDESKMEAIINNISALNDSLVLDDQYMISGDRIIIRKGQEGLKIDKEKLKEYMISALINNVSIVEVPLIQSKSQKIDLNQLYAKIYVAPQDASLASGDGKFNIIPEKNGTDFDMVAAKEQYDAAEASGEIVIPLRTIEPSIKLADMEAELYKDTIATASIGYQSTDIVKATVAKLNNITINPKEEFSFSKTVEMTGVSSDYSVVASVLYQAVLKSGMKITERVANEKPVSYVAPSLDAMVKSGSTDLKVQNTRNSPVKIVAIAQNGTIEVNILGQKTANDSVITLESKVIEKEAYTVKTENDSTMYVGARKVVTLGVDGYTSEAYKVMQNESGDELSRVLISRDKYAMAEEVVKVGTKAIVVTPTPTPEPEDEKPRFKLPAGWDIPESPYSRKK